jgi:hypothetical protein
MGRLGIRISRTPPAGTQSKAADEGQGKERLMDIKRLTSRIHPIGHILKRRQRHREMKQREKEFEELLAKEKKKLAARKNK